MPKYSFLEGLGFLALATYPAIEKYASRALPWAIGAYVGYRLAKWRYKK